METVLITGGTGLIGTALTKKLLEKGYHIIILTRDKRGQQSNTAHQNPEFAQWDIKTSHIDKHAIERADYIVHLAGAGIADKRWSEKRKKEIVDSRVNGSRLLVKYLKENTNKVKTIVSASGIGWYGADPEIPNLRPFIETDPPVNDFLGHTCRQWEESVYPVKEMGKRLVIFRTGIVMSQFGGALPKFKGPLKFGIAPILGNGRQIVSWIHIDDLVAIYLRALEDERMEGVYNAVAPDPVSNRQLMMTLAKNQKFYIPLPIPSFLLRMLFGELSIEVLKSASVDPARLGSLGFSFKYPEIGRALMAN